MLVPDVTLAIDNDFRVVTEGPFADPMFRQSLECVGVDAFFRSLAPCRFHEGFQEHQVSRNEQLTWAFTHNGAPYQCSAMFVFAGGEAGYMEIDDVGYVHLRCDALADTRIRVFDVRIGLHLLTQATKDARFLLLGANDFSGVAVSIAPMLSGLAKILDDPLGEAEEYGVSGVFGVDSLGRFGPVDLPDFEGHFPLDAEDIPPPPKERVSAYKRRMNTAATSGPTLVDCSPPFATSLIIANFVLKEYSSFVIEHFKGLAPVVEELAKYRKKERVSAKDAFTEEGVTAPAKRMGRPRTAVLRPGDPGRSISAHFGSDEVDAIKRHAESQNLSAGAWMREVIRRELRKLDKA